MASAMTTMTVTTVATLVLATAYTVAIGGSGWLWFAWVVLGLVTLGLATVREAEKGPSPHR
ncbi:hypothetical protein JJV70_14690 [Streptomyces sp. JJ66]|uniref:hypothetical protein n=1 Tax=Streptomyces sp. JJ66 TaxID=2803843 RepID=UPI001C57E273|nr:hypothetical protein [Streptomyces sp. JJ66]MBW1603325.1 hypothetical protein [Streptomyces sp. JJ66]